MRWNKKAILFVLHLLFVQLANAQLSNRVRLQINKAILYGDVIDYPCNGIDISDTNAIVSLIFQYDQFKDIKDIYFDSIGRIVKQSTKYQISEYVFKNNIVHKSTSYFYSDPFLENADSTNTTFYFNEKGVVDKIKIKSIDTSIFLKFMYTWSPNSCTVNLINENRQTVLTHIFIYNIDGSTFQWQILRNNLILLKHKIETNNKITTSIPFDLIYRNIVLRPNGKDHYIISNSHGKEIGTLNFVKEGR